MGYEGTDGRRLLAVEEGEIFLFEPRDGVTGLVCDYDVEGDRTCGRRGGRRGYGRNIEGLLGEGVCRCTEHKNQREKTPLFQHASLQSAQPRSLCQTQSRVGGVGNLRLLRAILRRRGIRATLPRLRGLCRRSGGSLRLCRSTLRLSRRLLGSGRLRSRFRPIGCAGSGLCCGFLCAAGWRRGAWRGCGFSFVIGRARGAMRCFARRRRQLLGGEGDLIHDGGIVAELEVQLASFRMRDREHIAGKSIGNRDGMSELRIAGDGIDEEEIGAAEAAFLIFANGALEIVQLRETNEGRQGLPVAGCAVVDDTEFQRAESGAAEGFCRIEGTERDLSVFEGHAAVVEAEGGGK